ncbi:hypothetical protein [Prosthecobacter sp.]|uniref:hypothetical protein n=1 Tax=Prosthecobacter sp. TaxID=1965333 RepID=UPI003783D1C0
MNRPVKLIGLSIVVATSAWVCRSVWIHRNPYSRDGLQMEWSYGATSTVPNLKMWADYRGQRIECPVFFGQMTDPELQFRDYDGDGRRDIVFENDQYKQVVSFIPAHGDTPPQFKVIRNDITWP